ncbi:hypothetical protein [Campylobacter coli]|uniref:hypothetical protein n=1 Tax=Campylobacter coli TaxID=195 RepID=UPI0005772D4B|nr:hypothetical protein [Campylobacter coli]ECL9187679.1 hypothetical protein [Campylobacter coli]ECL9450333.1 hypothetical protein [Campylobacter coli]ECO2754163.1 hypothetical protein [Campylobacter coli]HED6005516.1 hypothetical protein [Campylobacter coli]HEE9551093.1 hypothetical protein [Campylobacter coli]
MQNITSNLIFTNEQVAINYGLTTGLTIAKHLRTHNDEFIENTHYFLVENSFKNKTIKWTLEGVYMLGFFIKSPKAKEYRKKVAKLLREQTQARFKSLSDENLRLNSLNHHQKIGYKSQLAQQKEHYENKIKALKYDLEKKKELSFKRKLSKEELLELRKILAKDYGILCIKEWEFEFLAEKIALESTRMTTWDAVVKKLKQSLDYCQNYEEYEEKWRKILRR